MNNNLALKQTYEHLEELKDNTLVHQFAIKDSNASISLLNTLQSRMKLLENGSEKYNLYASYIETLENIIFRSIDLTADLMFSAETVNNPGITDSKIINTKVDDSGHLQVIHKQPEAIQTKLEFPKIDTKLSDVIIKDSIKDNLNKGTEDSTIIKWLKNVFESNNMFKDGKIYRSLSREVVEGEADRFTRYVQSIKNGLKSKETSLTKETTTVEKPVVTEEIVESVQTAPITLATEYSFGKLKHEVKEMIKNDATVEEVTAFINSIIDQKLMTKGGLEAFKSIATISGWYVNLKRGLDMQTKKKVETKEATKVESIIAKESPEDVLKEAKAKEMLTTLAAAEKQLQAGRRDKAVGIIKHHLALNKEVFSDQAIHGLLNWLDENSFQHRNPMDILNNVPLSIRDVIDEVKHRIENTTQSRKEIESFIKSKVMGVNLKEFNGNLIKEDAAFAEWFRNINDWQFTKSARFQKPEETPEDIEDLVSQEEFEANFKQKIERSKATDHAAVYNFAKDYQREVQPYTPDMDSEIALGTVVSYVKELNPALYAIYEKHFESLPESTETENDDTTENAVVVENEVEILPNEFSTKYVDANKKIAKLTTLSKLANFMLINKDKYSTEDMLDLAQELILGNVVKDAETVYDNDKGPERWDRKNILNWFKLVATPLLENKSMLTAKTPADLRVALAAYIEKHPDDTDENRVDQVKSILFVDTPIKSNYVKKLIKSSEFLVHLKKVISQIIEHNAQTETK